MGGKVALSIVKPDGKILNNITWTGADMTLFFSEEYVNNDVEGAIRHVSREMKTYRNKFLEEFSPGFEQKPYEWTQLMAPSSYGLVVIDFTKKIIRSMQDYNNPAHKDLITYIRALEGGSDEPFAQLTQENMLVVLNKTTKERYSFKEFFGTTDTQEICKLMDYVRYGEKANEFEDKKHLKIFSYKNPYFNNELKIVPHNLDFELVTYHSNEYSVLLSDLVKDGHTFSDKEKSQWINFIRERIEYDTEQSNPQLNYEEIRNLTLQIATEQVEKSLNPTTSKLKIK